MTQERSVTVQGTTLWACDDQGAYYEDRCHHAIGMHGGRRGTLYCPMLADGSPDVENFGEIEYAYDEV